LPIPVATTADEEEQIPVALLGRSVKIKCAGTQKKRGTKKKM